MACSSSRMAWASSARAGTRGLAGAPGRSPGRPHADAEPLAGALSRSASGRGMRTPGGARVFEQQLVIDAPGRAPAWSREVGRAARARPCCEIGLGREPRDQESEIGAVAMRASKALAPSSPTSVLGRGPRQEQEAHLPAIARVERIERAPGRGATRDAVEQNTSRAVTWNRRSRCSGRGRCARSVATVGDADRPGAGRRHSLERRCPPCARPGRACTGRSSSRNSAFRVSSAPG